ncbi:hypothetical protein SAMN02787148_10935 [Burkholderia vietnamiensis]|nr:hypothetical protein EC918_107226 [Burkholderia vietnamiensis]SCZ31984.1 hypothetical protein SAMN02787148_10935 [Burkholderia vietnamiensis]SFX86151.1 hypothetical protein SAMN02787160_10936 [Burkholderia vietnamiensis]
MLVKKLQSTQDLFSLGNSERRQPSDLFSAIGMSGPVLHQCFWSSSSDFLNLPNVIAAMGDDLETIFADVATYYGNVSPLSAYVHVVKEDLLSQIGLRGKRYQSPKFDISSRMLGVLVSLIFGEAEATRRIGSLAPAMASYSACKRTFSYVLARTVILYPTFDIDDVLHKWLLARQLSRMDSPTYLIKLISRIGIGLSAQSRPMHDDELLPRRVFDYVRGDATSEEIAEALVSTYPGLANTVSVFSGVFDHRMQAFNAVVKEVLSSETRGSEFGSICLAFFANAISPGSYAYAELLNDFIKKYPSVHIWYALFSGTSKEDSWQSMGEGVGKKIARDLIQPFSLEERPRSDISIDELVVLSRAQISQLGIKPVHQKSILVSLLPGVDTYVRLSNEGDRIAEGGNSKLLSELANRDRQVRKMLGDVMQMLEPTEAYRQERSEIDMIKTNKKLGRY